MKLFLKVYIILAQSVFYKVILFGHFHFHLDSDSIE